MITVNILICTINKGVVRILDNLPEPREGVSYIVAYQYTDERYWELIPEQLTARKDVMLAKHKGVGLSQTEIFRIPWQRPMSLYLQMTTRGFQMKDWM